MEINRDDLLLLLHRYEEALSQSWAWRMIASEYQTPELADKYTAYLKSVADTARDDTADLRQAIESGSGVQQALQEFLERRKIHLL